jgi:hypothetical protein
MCLTGADTRYGSPTYNPHSLKRRWGLFLSGRNVAMAACLKKDGKTPGFRTHLDHCIQNNLPTILGLPRGTQTENGSFETIKPDKNRVGPIILQDGISDLPTLIDEVGLDIVALSVLSDVPLHRPRRLELEDLVSHWRWLRQIWQFSCEVEDSCATRARVKIDPAIANSAGIVQNIRQSRYNIAIAEMRTLFQDIRKTPANRHCQAQLQFLRLLCLFCPYIGHELLYRYGLVDQPDQPES